MRQPCRPVPPYVRNGLLAREMARCHVTTNRPMSPAVALIALVMALAPRGSLTTWRGEVGGDRCIVPVAVAAGGGQWWRPSATEPDRARRQDRWTVRLTMPPCAAEVVARIVVSNRRRRAIGAFIVVLISRRRGAPRSSRRLVVAACAYTALTGMARNAVFVSNLTRASSGTTRATRGPFGVACAAHEHRANTAFDVGVSGSAFRPTHDALCLPQSGRTSARS